MHVKFYNIKFLYILFAVLITNWCSSFAQLTVTSGLTSGSLAAKLAGPGVTILSDSLICDTAAEGSFVSVTTPITIDSGIILCTGKARSAAGPETGTTSFSFSAAGDADLNAILGSSTTTTDACALIIKFIPKGDTVSFNYQFGSEEYISSTCGLYNDAFAFFIMGPGISTSFPGVNMALVPGTSIPVQVNSINSGTACTGGGCSISNCTSLGTGSPFTSYYFDNAGRTQVSYRGYTTLLTAKHSVIPCDTYRIKLVIADGGSASRPNYIYDSGVFIEGGSLTSNSFHFDRPNIGNTIMGLPNSIVKGCGPDSIRIKISKVATRSYHFNLAYSGSGISGTDFARLPDTVNLRAGDSVVAFPVTGLTTGAGGIKTISIVLTSPSICGVIDTMSINIIDAPFATIYNHDTIVCKNATVQLNTNGSAGLNYFWSPGASMSDSTISNPVLTASVDNTYRLTAILPGSLCPAISHLITVSTKLPNFTINTPDTLVCESQSFQFSVTGNDTLLYNWTPGTGISGTDLKQPLMTPQTTTTYTLTGTFAGTTCAIQKSVTVTVVPHYEVQTQDIILCNGATIVLQAQVTPAGGAYAYQWTGPNSYSSGLLNPVITTATALNAGIYNLVVTSSGICPVRAQEAVTVFETPDTKIMAPPITVCQYSPAMPLMVTGYSNLMWFSSPADTTPTLFAPYPKTDSIGTQKFYAAMISLQSNCLGTVQEIEVSVKQCCNGTIYVPSGFTPNNDGKNDELHVVKSAEYALSEFTIYNRWGVQVFHATGEDAAWDGTINGTPADIGTYYYSVVANCTNSDKKPINLHGDVTLIR